MTIRPQKRCILATLMSCLFLFQGCQPNLRLNVTDEATTSDEAQPCPKRSTRLPTPDLSPSLVRQACSGAANQAINSPLSPRARVLSTYDPLTTSKGKRARLQHTSGQWKADRVDTTPSTATRQAGATINYRQILNYQEQVLGMMKALYPNQPHRDVAFSLNNIGTAYHALGEVKKGLVYQEQALEMMKALYPDQSHPAVVNSLGNVGTAYEALGEHKTARHYYEEGLEMGQRLDSGVAAYYVDIFNQKLTDLNNVLF